MGVSDLLEVLDLLITMSGTFLLLVILLLIGKLMQNMGNMMKGFIPILIIGFLLISSLGIENNEAEPIDTIYTDSKTFDYLSICRTYPTYNSSFALGASVIDWLCDAPNGFNYLNSSNEDQKPSGVIIWSNDTHNTMNLISKMVFNFTDNHIFKINIMYISNNSLTYNLPFLYNEYISDNYTNNVTMNYKYLDGGKRTFLNTYEAPQTSQQRFSNINHSGANFSFGGDNFYNGYKFYEKKSSDDTTQTVFNVSKLKHKDIKTISCNEWNTITLTPTTFYNSQYNRVWKSEDFMNIGIVKENLSDIVIIDLIEVKMKKVPISTGSTPFLEYYEFRHISDNSSRTLFMIDLIRNDYQNLYIDSVNISLDSIGRIKYVIAGHDYYVSGVTGYPLNTTVGDESFIGYQFSLFYDKYNQTYSIQIYAKYGENVRAVSGFITYNYRYDEIFLWKEYGYVGLLNIENYEGYSNAENKISHTAGSFKWDQKDNAFTRIDIDSKGDTVLIKDIDSSGFRFPSLNDLGKMIFNVIKPVLGSLQVLQDNLMIPIDSITSKLDNLLSSTDIISGFVDQINQAIGQIQGILGPLSGVVDSINVVISQIKTTVNSISGFVNTVMLTLTLFYNQFMDAYAYFGGLYGILQYFVEGIVNAFKDVVNTFLTAINNFIYMINFYFDLTFSIIGASFIYFLVFKINRYAETDDLNDLWAIFEVLEKVVELIKWVFWLVWSIIP